MPITERPLSISQLVDLLQETVEDNFMQVVIEGEISNLARPTSGHLYLTLKDSKAQIRTVMFRGSARLLKFRPEDGQQVLCRGRMTVYKQRGDMQFIAESLDVVGSGSLQVAFEQLKEKLSVEGLFSVERKRPLPTFPVTVGIVTSGSGAALHDMLEVFRLNAAGIRVIVKPVRVQGEQAAQEISEAIEDLNNQGDSDVLIVGRGGGSLEDLWAFNEECVARAIATSMIPIVSAVGHEVDVSIADYVADYRAATPTSAAEQIIKSRLELESHLDQVRLRLGIHMAGRVNLLKEKVNGLRQRLVSPSMQLELWQHRLKELMARMYRAADQNQQCKRERLSGLAGRLDALSPLQTLKRGYAIVKRDKDGTAVVNASVLNVDETLQLHFASGGAKVRVEKVKL